MASNKQKSGATSFLDIAHKYLVFRDDWENLRTLYLHKRELGDWQLTKLKIFKEMLDKAGVIAMTDHPILIMGPQASGQEGLARAIADADPKRHGFKALNCLDSDNSTDVLSNANIANSATTVYVEHFDEASEPFQRRLVAILERQEPYTPRFIFLYNPPDDLSSMEKWSKIGHIARHSQIKLQTIDDRLWDIVPLVVYSLRDSCIRYITYNSLDFFVCYDWPGNIAELEQVVEASRLSARKSENDNTIKFDDVQKCFMPASVSSLKKNTPMGHRYIGRFGDPEETTIDTHPFAPFSMFDWYLIEHHFGSQEIVTYLSTNAFFRREGHEIIYGQIGPDEYDYSADPNYELNELRRFIYFQEKMPKEYSPFFSNKWLKDHADARVFEGGEIGFFQAEEILFDIKKMEVALERFMPPRQESAIIVTNNYCDYQLVRKGIRKGVIRSVAEGTQAWEILKSLVGNFRNTGKLGMKERDLLVEAGIRKAEAKEAVDLHIQQMFGTKKWKEFQDIVRKGKGHPYYYLTAPPGAE